eukprot:3934115-Rhodomonas_salina.2
MAVPQRAIVKRAENTRCFRTDARHLSLGWASAIPISRFCMLLATRSLQAGTSSVLPNTGDRDLPGASSPAGTAVGIPTRSTGQEPEFPASSGLSRLRLTGIAARHANRLEITRRAWSEGALPL